MGKDNRRNRNEGYDKDREDKIMESWKRIRKPTPPPGRFHTPKKERRKRTQDYIEEDLYDAD